MEKASEQLKACREQFANQAEMAERLGVDRSVMCRLLAGKHKPSLDLAVRIEALTGIPPREWV